MKMEKDKFDIFMLSWRKAWIIVVTGFISIMLHNLFYAIFGFEDLIFFSIVTVILPLYFLISLVYTIIKKS